MSTPRVLHRIGTAAVLSAVAFAFVAAPAGAAGRTRVVDNDGRASAADCDATAATFRSIQKAIDASGPGDTVKVCPGTYVGKLTISGGRAGLRLLSTKAKGATIKSPTADFSNGQLLLIDGVANVTVKGFKLRALTAGLGDSLDGIVADGSTGLTIQANDVGWAGPAKGRSQLMTGILVKGGTTGTISGNTILDPLDDGIRATDAGTGVTISGNSIKSLFAGQSGIESDDGIDIHSGAAAQVTGNTMVTVSGSGPLITRMASGVELSSAAASTVVSGNTITEPIVGISTKGNGYQLKDNTVVGRQIGIELLATDGATVQGNTSRATAAIGYGIEVLEGSDGNLISGNDLRDSFGDDCHEADDDNDGINNTWTSNESNDASASLCTNADDPA